MPMWPYHQQQQCAYPPPTSNAPRRLPPQHQQQYAPRRNTRSDRHGWSEFIASQTHPEYPPPREFNQTRHSSIDQYGRQQQHRLSNAQPRQPYSDANAAGSSHNEIFCVDRVGLEHNKPPAFTQRYKVALPDNEEQSCLQAPSGNGRKSACFNCLETDHMISDCPHPRDPERIRRNKQVFRENTQSNSSGSNTDRYHGPTDRKILRGGVSAARRLGKYAQLQPGEFSKDLRSALGLNDQQLPPFVYRMRELGYPPGWLQECLVYRSVNEGNKEEYDFDRLISFPGFNQAPSTEFLDESDFYGVPAYSDEMFGRESFVQSLINSGCTAIGANQSGGEEDRGDPMELDEDEDVDRSNVNEPVDSDMRIQQCDEEAKSASTQEISDVESSYDNLHITQSSSTNTESRNADQMESPIDESKCTETTLDEVVDLSKLSNWTESFLTRDNIGETLEESDGTPLVLDEERLSYKMPSLDKFADGINEHRFFENLPGTVGNFARIMETVKSARNQN